MSQDFVRLFPLFSTHVGNNRYQHLGHSICLVSKSAKYFEKLSTSPVKCLVKENIKFHKLKLLLHNFCLNVINTTLVEGVSMAYSTEQLLLKQSPQNTKFTCQTFKS